MFNKAYIEDIIRDEIPDPTHNGPAISIFEHMLESSHYEKTLSVFELSNILDNKIEQKELYKIAFEMIDLTLPIFSLIVHYNDSHFGEIPIDEEYEIYHILTKQNMSHPIQGDVITFKEYKNRITFLFRLNKRLFSRLAIENLKSND